MYLYILTGSVLFPGIPHQSKHGPNCFGSQDILQLQSATDELVHSGTIMDKKAFSPMWGKLAFRYWNHRGYKFYICAIHFVPEIVAIMFP